MAHEPNHPLALSFSSCFLDGFKPAFTSWPYWASSRLHWARKSQVIPKILISDVFDSLYRFLDHTPTLHSSPDAAYSVDGQIVYFGEVKSPQAGRYLLRSYDRTTGQYGPRKHGPIRVPIYGVHDLSSGEFKGECLSHPKCNLNGKGPCADNHHAQMQIGMLIMRETLGHPVKASLYTCQLPVDVGGAQVWLVPFEEAYANRLAVEAHALYRLHVPAAVRAA